MKRGSRVAISWPMSPVVSSTKFKGRNVAKAQKRCLAGDCSSPWLASLPKNNETGGVGRGRRNDKHNAEFFHLLQLDGSISWYWQICNDLIGIWFARNRPVEEARGERAPRGRLGGAWPQLGPGSGGLAPRPITFEVSWLVPIELLWFLFVSWWKWAGGREGRGGFDWWQSWFGKPAGRWMENPGSDNDSINSLLVVHSTRFFGSECLIVENGFWGTTRMGNIDRLLFLLLRSFDERQQIPH